MEFFCTFVGRTKTFLIAVILNTYSRLPYLNKVCSCSICDIIYKDKWLYLKHIQGHTIGILYHECELCGNHFLKYLILRTMWLLILETNHLSVNSVGKHFAILDYLGSILQFTRARKLDKCIAYLKVDLF